MFAAPLRRFQPSQCRYAGAAQSTACPRAHDKSDVAGLRSLGTTSALDAHMRPLVEDSAISAGVLDTSEAVYAFFLGRVRDRLHVVLCFSPVGARFSRRAQQFPGLINGCTVDWFLAWPEEALTAVSSKAIDEFPMACPAPVRAARP